MSKRKHTFTVTSFADLAKAYPLAVTEKVIPEKREQKADYKYISGLLDRQIAVPGIKITESIPQSASDTEQATQPQGETPEAPSRTLRDVIVKHANKE